jgi:very-short-patch-repair endonuclease
MSIENARRLRKETTDAERKLWSALRQKQLDGYKFHRQVPIGDFVADFACPSARLIIEVDGGQQDLGREKDLARTAWLEARGYRVMRFWNNDVLGNLDGVVRTILSALHDHPHPSLPLKGGGDKQEHLTPHAVAAISFAFLRSALPEPNTGTASSLRTPSRLGSHSFGRPDAPNPSSRASGVASPS